MFSLMFRSVCSIALLAAASASASAAQAPAERTLTVSGEVGASADTVYNSFTTPEGIVKAWGVAKAKVDFRVGGQIRTAYQPDADLDSPKAIVNTILAYEPGRMLAIKPTAPEGAPDWLQAICENGFNVLRIEPLASERCRVTVAGMGYKDGPLFDQAYEFFKRGNEWTIKHMQEAFGAPSDPGRTERILALFRRLTDGEWIAELRPPGGGVIRIRTIWRPMFADLPGNPFLVAAATMGGDDGLGSHATFIVGPDPSSGGVSFWHFGERAEIAQGDVLLKDDHTVVYDWRMHTPARADKPAAATLWRFEHELGDQAYTIRGWTPPSDAAQGKPAAITAAYRRVDVAPPEFTRPRAPRPAAQAAPAVIIEPIVVETDVDAPIEDVWRAWTTTDGVKSWLCEDANVELRRGGPFEILFSKNAPAGERGSEGCTITDFDAPRSLKFTWNAPPKFTHARSRRTSVTVTLEPLGPERTRVKLVHSGHQDQARENPDHEAEWREVRAYFAAAWPKVGQWLQDHFKK